MANPTSKMKKLATSHPHTIPTGPAGTENDNVDAIDGSSPMILKAIAKTWIVE
jgi:hypothetical protein